MNSVSMIQFNSVLQYWSPRSEAVVREKFRSFVMRPHLNFLIREQIWSQNTYLLESFRYRTIHQRWNQCEISSLFLVLDWPSKDHLFSRKNLLTPAHPCAVGGLVLKKKAPTSTPISCSANSTSGHAQGRLTINNRYTQREFKLKFSALLKDYHLKYAETVKNNLLKHRF